MQKILGGDRLGTGKKMKVDMHGWGRSTFNQSRIWRSTMACGPLTPCFIEWGLLGTTFEIDINALGHTLPTNSPLFGSFKMQVDFFACPVRLYQGLLHNNATTIGLNMSDVLMPQIEIGNENIGVDATNTSSLLNYIGIKGYNEEISSFNAIPLLAYYDIFKNYYSNKQEENAKVLQYKSKFGLNKIDSILVETTKVTSGAILEKIITMPLGFILENQTDGRVGITNQEYEINYGAIITINAENQIGRINRLQIDMDNGESILFENPTSSPNETYDIFNMQDAQDNNYTKPIGKIKYNENKIVINLYASPTTQGNIIEMFITNESSKTEIVDFPLTNIDDARREILKKTTIGERLTIKYTQTTSQKKEHLDFLPYSANFNNDGHKGKRKNLNGLVLKTYLNDIYNCWLSTEFIDKINEMTSITPNSNGEITMDALILQKKVYNVLNRIAISGGTYEEWQESIYGENVSRRAESPIYLGGLSSEITFDEVVSTASSTNAQGENQPLATLGGKGVMTNFKGGKIVYKCNEATLIIGICSITPRIDYHQGNKWWATELNSMDDFHKPGLDGIGFGNIIANNVHWKDSTSKGLAKSIAWINYQTAVNEVFGQFALDDTDADSLYHMVLRRNYETDQQGNITDFTTYIDPSKFNYPFISEELTAQNFWVQLGFNVKSRRKMASSEIPNL